MAGKKTKGRAAEPAEVLKTEGANVVTENVTEVTAAEEVITKDAAKAADKAETKSAAVTGDTVTKKKVKNFSKQSILRFEKYSRYKDLLGAVLEDNKRYSVDEVDLILKEDD